MSARAGMSNLISRLRSLTNAGTAQFTLNGTNYFSDDHLQELLDSNVQILSNHPLTWVPDTIGGGTIQWTRALIGYNDLEEASSGTTRWIVRDATGAEQGTANYTPDYVVGEILFDADQGGTIYYLSARSYDLYAAAADVWKMKQSFYSEWFAVSSEGQKMEWQQAFDHAVRMEESMRGMSGRNSKSDSVWTSEFVRVDV